MKEESFDDLWNRATPIMDAKIERNDHRKFFWIRDIDGLWVMPIIKGNMNGFSITTEKKGSRQLLKVGENLYSIRGVRIYSL